MITKILAVVAASVPAVLSAQSYYARAVLTVDAGSAASSHRWVSGEWGEWSSACSNSAVRERTVSCISADGATAPDSSCIGSRPDTTETGPNTARCGIELVINGTFSGESGWTMVQSGYDGAPSSRYMRMHGNPGRAGEISSVAPITLEPGLNYRLSARAITDDGDPEFITINLVSEGRTIASTSIRPGGTWTPLSTTFQVSGPTSATIRATLPNRISNILLDDVSIQAVP